MTEDADKSGAANLQREAERDNREGARRERPDPPVGTDGPAADRLGTVASEDINSADDK